MTRKPALPPFARRLLSACMMLVLFACHAPALEQFVRPAGVPVDVLPEYNNLSATALSEDCESVRLALGGGSRNRGGTRQKPTRQKRYVFFWIFLLHSAEKSSIIVNEGCFRCTRDLPWTCQPLSILSVAP